MSDINSTDSTNDDLPDTQPFDLQLLNEVSQVEHKPWGHLIPLDHLHNTVTLTRDEFKLVRRSEDVSQNSEVQTLAIDQTNLPRGSWAGFSRIHFSLKKIDDDVLITDLSSNGTFVNREPIGKGKIRPLVNNDRITFSRPDLGGFKLIIQQNDDDDEKSNLPKDVTSKYIVGKMKGSGVTGKVYIGYQRDNFRKVALKIMPKTDYVQLTAIEEIKILSELSHPNIIKVEGGTDYNNYFVIVMELASGGELFDYVLEDYNKKSFDESVAKLQFFQILSAVHYLHSKKICHRDLKLENILMFEKSRTSLIKIADFGLSKKVRTGTKMTTYVGTPCYIAPEVLKNENGNETSTYELSADMWSLGCILFSLLCGSPAFHDTKDEGLRQKISCGNYARNNVGLTNVSANAKDLVEKLLKVDPRDRLTAAAAFAHPWLMDPEVIRQANALTGMQSDLRHISSGVRDLALESRQPISSNKRKHDSDDEKTSKKKRRNDSEDESRDENQPPAN